MLSLFTLDQLLDRWCLSVRRSVPAAAYELLIAQYLACGHSPTVSLSIPSPHIIRVLKSRMHRRASLNMTQGRYRELALNYARERMPKGAFDVIIVEDNSLFFTSQPQDRQSRRGR